MLIAVNTRFLLKDKLEGIGWFTYETIRRMVKNHPEHRFLFLFDRDYDPSFVFADNVIPVKVSPPARHPLLWRIWYDYSLPRVFKKYKPDVFISTDGMLSLNTSVPTVLVLHDLAYIHYPDHIPQNAFRYLKKFTPHFLEKAKRIITVSAYSKQDIHNVYGTDLSKIDVVYNGANDDYHAISVAEKVRVRRQYTDGKNYFIYVGSIHPRKNIGNLFLAYDAMRKSGATDIKLVIVGRKAWKTENTFDVFESMQFKHDVVFTGHLPVTQLSGLMGAADALVYPSMFEGFGIPVLEALYAGVPVICSNRTSLPEVGGDTAIYFDPENVEAITAAMEQFIINRAEYRTANPEEIRKKFNWDISAEKFFNTIVNVYDNTRPD